VRNVAFIHEPNRVIQNLPLAEIKAVRSYSTRLHVKRGDVLFKPGEKIELIYFPETAVVSVLGESGHGGRIELWSVGNEGIAGIDGILSGVATHRKVVQVSGDVLAAPAPIVRKHFLHCGVLHAEVMRYCESLVVHVAQLGLCNSSHRTEQRLSRWLLMMQDRIGTRTLSFTQDFIAGILGTRRATISVAVAALQNAGCIRCTPGSIAIESRRGLQAASCGCYRKLRTFS
jgi:CRP-like cAMP-binding protein